MHGTYRINKGGHMVHKILQKIEVLQGTTPTMIFADNQGNIKLAHNPIYYSQQKLWMSDTTSFEKK